MPVNPAKFYSDVLRKLQKQEALATEQARAAKEVLPGGLSGPGVLDAPRFIRESSLVSSPLRLMPEKKPKKFDPDYDDEPNILPEQPSFVIPLGMGDGYSERLDIYDMGNGRIWVSPTGGDSMYSDMSFGISDPRFSKKPPTEDELLEFYLRENFGEPIDDYADDFDF